MQRPDLFTSKPSSDPIPSHPKLPANKWSVSVKSPATWLTNYEIVK